MSNFTGELLHHNSCCSISSFTTVQFKIASILLAFAARPGRSAVMACASHRVSCWELRTGRVHRHERSRNFSQCIELSYSIRGTVLCAFIVRTADGFAQWIGLQIRRLRVVDRPLLCVFQPSPSIRARCRMGGCTRDGVGNVLYGQIFTSGSREMLCVDAMFSRCAGRAAQPQTHL